MEATISILTISLILTWILVPTLLIAFWQAACKTDKNYKLFRVKLRIKECEEKLSNLKAELRDYEMTLQIIENAKNKELKSNPEKKDENSAE